MVIGYLHKEEDAQLDAREWSVSAAFDLDAGDRTVRCSDVVVDGAGGNADDYTASAPALVAEVLSPSTAESDLGDKAAEYLRVSGLSAYLVFAQRTNPRHGPGSANGTPFHPVPA